MIRFVVCGMGKDEIARLIEQTAGDAASARVTSDFEGATSILEGSADYYIGACQSGAGGALAVAIAMLGWDRVARLSGVGLSTADEGQIAEHVRSGKRAFGIAHSHVDTSVPAIVRAVMNQPG